MAFIPTVNTVKASLVFDLFGQEVVNTLWFEYGLGQQPPITAMTTLASNLQDWWGDNIAPSLSPDLKWTEIQVVDQTNVLAPSIAQAASGDAGTALGSSLPSADCVCVSFRTAQRGRSARGRNYVSGILNLDVVGNTVDPTTLFALEDGYDYLVNTAPTPWNWVVVSHITGGFPRFTGLIQPILDVVITSTTIKHMDSRNP